MSISSSTGMIALMGSGELTATMVEVHKALLSRSRYGATPRAVFIDTPAGFQLNADQIAHKARQYFHKRVQQDLSVASFKSAEGSDALAVEQCYQTLAAADYMFIGPGSPTYALRQWQASRIPELMRRRVEQGACLVTASAAALTVGRKTLPVYEIYKVGQEPHWVDGLNLLGAFGFDWAVVPHWNNAEGGNHDTRFCFMGESRLKVLESRLPEKTSILGVDEHTALIIDLAEGHAVIKGMGTVVLRRCGREQRFDKGGRIPLAVLRGESEGGMVRPVAAPSSPSATVGTGPREVDIWQAVERLGDRIQADLGANRIEQATHGLLELERYINQVYEQLQERNAEGAAREVLRNQMALFGTALAGRPESREACLEPVVAALLQLRAHFRRNKQWAEADAVRDCLAAAEVMVEDTPEGARWSLKD